MLVLKEMTVHFWLPDKTLFTIIFIECQNHFASHLEQSNLNSWRSIMIQQEIFLVLFLRQMSHKFHILRGTSLRPFHENSLIILEFNHTGYQMRALDYMMTF